MPTSSAAANALLFLLSASAAGKRPVAGASFAAAGLAAAFAPRPVLVVAASAASSGSGSATTCPSSSSSAVADADSPDSPTEAEAEAETETEATTETARDVEMETTTDVDVDVDDDMDMMMMSMPRWDLSRFGFPDPHSSELDDYVSATSELAVQFKSTYEGHLDPSSSPPLLLLGAIEEYERIGVRRTTVSSYLSLSYDTSLDDDALKKRKGSVMEVQSKMYGDHLSWFELDLAALDDEKLGAQYESEPKLERYRAYIDEVRRTRPHNLSKDVERALTVRSPYVGTRPLTGFLDKELSLMRFSLPDSTDGAEDEKVNMEVLLSRLSNSKDADFRASALRELNEGLGGSTVRISALSLSSVAGSWLVENEERKYATLRSRRNLGNNCPDEVVDGLLRGVREAGVPLCKRFYSLKKAVLKSTQGLDKFRWSDRNAPIDIPTTSSEGEEKKKEDDRIPWSEAVRMVERGYRKFSPRMAEMFLDMVKEKRIDVPPTDGKKGGAYCAGVVPGVGPFQLLNFDGTKRDVATLAHESGHGCHDILAYDMGYLQYHPPLTLAETASIFGEMIVFRDLLELASTPGERLSLLMGKIDDVVNSVVRQCSFDRFEELAHGARSNGELSAEELDGFWVRAVEEYYGTAGDDGGDSPFDSYDDISHLWSYVPHFHHVPFYVYSYAFADLVVGALYKSYGDSPDGFEDRLLDLLRAGGTKDFVEALGPFGLEPDSPTFWAEALDAHLGGLVEEAEELARELGYATTAAST